jgi:orotidine-5'-phosphate decarboxylase
MTNPIFVALDTVSVDQAKAWARDCLPHVGGVKLGLEFFANNGPWGVREVAGAIEDMPIFLDLKLHDIPNTVAGALRAAAAWRPSFVTVHALGGPAMIRAALDGAAEGAERLGSDRPRILAVTVLTSLDDSDLQAMGMAAAVDEQVARLALMAIEAGADGLVCAPGEVAGLRAALGDGPELMVPGIRPEGSAADDQKRVMTPKNAIASGATHIVVGRPITQADDPAAAARQIAASLR